MENEKNEHPSNPFPVDLDYQVYEHSLRRPRFDEDGDDDYYEDEIVDGRERIEDDFFLPFALSHCPNCGDKIGRYQTPSPFEPGGLIVGLYIPERYLLCYHCATDRSMIGKFLIWEKILELRHSFREEKFEHDEFLRRELQIINSYVQGDELPSDAIQEIERYLAKRREAFPSREHPETDYFTGESHYPYLSLSRNGLFNIRGFGSSQNLARISKSEVLAQWNPRTQESTIQISAGSVLAQLDVAAIGETTALWFRAFTIRELLKSPAERFIWPNFPDHD
jgi:hypothetical protein